MYTFGTDGQQDALEHGIAIRGNNDYRRDDDGDDECWAPWLELDRSFYTKGFRCCFRDSSTG